MNRKTVKRAISVIVVLIAFLFGYGMGLSPQSQEAARVNAQNPVQYKQCYSIKTSIEGYKEFNKGEINEDEALILPSGWMPVGFTGNNNNMFALICERQ